MNARLLLALTLLPLAVHAADWPQYRGLDGTGITAEKVTKPWTAASKPVWKTPIVGGFASFAVAGDKAFTLALREIEGTNQESLVALNAATGKELWIAPLNFAKYQGGGDSGTPENKGGDGPRSTPTVVGKNVYAYSSELSLRCFDAATGKIAWTRDVMKEHNGRNISWSNASSPLLEGGLLYVGGGGQGESLLAINPADGKVVWKAFDEKITHATPVAATILGQRQIIFFVQSGLLAVEPKSGKELWRYPFKFSTSTAASPVVSGDIVYCSAGYNVGAGAAKITKVGDKFTATEIYRLPGNKPLANHWSTPIVKDGFLYGMFQFKEYGKGPVKCVDIAKGEVKWEKEGFGPGQVILAGDKVVALADNGDLVLIDPNPAAYKELNRVHLVDGKCWSTPVLANGRIYVRSTKEAACLDVK
ncbi:MAG TPA: PQQ-binding-like beta-propeller repeat protein [Chthoniobacteraceae bacterium]|jgi:outer membrane protein assembly factor BamB|nr:PQQ-binding-like beta-propeller repeat protein [Chthoniobacteraceae bacterium]